MLAPLTAPNQSPRHKCVCGYSVTGWFSTPQPNITLPTIIDSYFESSAEGIQTDPGRAFSPGLRRRGPVYWINTQGKRRIIKEVVVVG